MMQLRQQAWLSAVFATVLLTACSGDDVTAKDVCPKPACSGHGSCSMEKLRPVCACDEGYTGAVCSRCDEGYVRDSADACVAAPTAECADDSCPDNAACSDGGGVISCSCTPPWTGEGCDACGPGWHADGDGGCALDRECIPSSCSGRGTCSVADNVISCVCDTGFTGDFCDEFDDGCGDTDPCNDNGYCVGSEGTARCVCDTGYAGATCDTCYLGYRDAGDDGCVLNPTCEPASCSRVGTCALVDGLPTCTCDAGYAGAGCQVCDDGYHRSAAGVCSANVPCATDDPCGDHGTCSDVAGRATCTCDDGYVGAACDACHPGYVADDDGNCILRAQCDEFVCNGGTCDDSTGVVACSDCPTGYSGDFCQTNDDDCVHNACGAGTCVDGIGDYTCLCPDNTYGEQCQ